MQYVPAREEFERLAGEYNLIPVYQEIGADLETPVSAFLKLEPGNNAFLLESIEGGERLGRYSFLGVDPHIVIESHDGMVTTHSSEDRATEARDDPLDAIEEIMSCYKVAPVEDMPSFFGGAVGYLGYDAVRHFEPRVPGTAQDDLGLPEMAFMFTDTIVVFDHVRRRVRVVANAHVNGNVESAYEDATAKIDSLVERLRRPSSATPLDDSISATARPFVSNMSKKDFLASVRRAREYIFAGDILQVVLSQRFSTELSADPFDVYRTLRAINPSPYMYYISHGDLKLIGSSPEPLVKVADGRVVTRPIAGTRPRGETAAEDRRLETELLADEKERAEHIMLVDLGRNDLGRVCNPGTVQVDELMEIEHYSHVMHIVSNVVGELAEGETVFDVLRAAFPAGTVSGAPKIRAMEIIDELEPTARGPYAGVVGYFGYAGTLDTCITIRTIVVAGGSAYIQAGAGIVADSDPEREYTETLNKAKALMRTIDIAEQNARGARAAV